MPKKLKAARGLTARGTKGAPREKLAKAAGFRSDAEIAELFPGTRNQKLIRQLQQALADLVSSLHLTEGSTDAVASHYGGLIRALADPVATSTSRPPESTKIDNTSGRAVKQAALVADALRQMVLEAVETPLAMLPSLLADDALSDQQKLQKLGVYSTALEALYEPLDLEPIGEPGEVTAFDPRHHDATAALSKGDPCTVRQIGFRRGDAVVRKAVVVGAE